MVISEQPQHLTPKGREFRSPSQLLKQGKNAETGTYDRGMIETTSMGGQDNKWKITIFKNWGRVLHSLSLTTCDYFSSSTCIFWLLWDINKCSKKPIAFYLPPHCWNFFVLPTSEVTCPNLIFKELDRYKCNLHKSECEWVSQRELLPTIKKKNILWLNIQLWKRLQESTSRQNPEAVHGCMLKKKHTMIIKALA